MSFFNEGTRRAMADALRRKKVERARQEMMKPKELPRLSSESIRNVRNTRLLQSMQRSGRLSTVLSDKRLGG